MDVLVSLACDTPPRHSTVSSLVVNGKAIVSSSPAMRFAGTDCSVQPPTDEIHRSTFTDGSTRTQSVRFLTTGKSITSRLAAARTRTASTLSILKRSRPRRTSGERAASGYAPEGTIKTTRRIGSQIRKAGVEVASPVAVTTTAPEPLRSASVARKQGSSHRVRM